MSKKEIEFKVDVVPVEKAGIIERPSRPSRYAAILDAIRGLKKGQAVKVPLPEKTDPMIVANRLTSVIRNYGIKPPEGMTFVKRAGEGNTLVVTLGQKRAEPGTAARKPARPKAARKPAKSKAEPAKAE